jgi:hypothetical protein
VGKSTTQNKILTNTESLYHIAKPVKCDKGNVHIMCKRESNEVLLKSKNSFLKNIELGGEETWVEEDGLGMGWTMARKRSIQLFTVLAETKLVIR